MTAQWRAKQKGKDFEEWVDIGDGRTAFFSGSLTELEELQVREKPAFEPGWYWATVDDTGRVIPERKRLIEWLTEPQSYDIRYDYRYERVTELPKELV